MAVDLEHTLMQLTYEYYLIWRIMLIIFVFGINIIIVFSRSHSRRVRTLYACLGENDGELSFEPNQIITNGKLLLLLLLLLLLFLNLLEMVIIIDIVEVICQYLKKRNCFIINRGQKLPKFDR
jgi:hypothetical protein